MKASVLCLSLALFGCVYAEPPSGYNYNRPSGGHSSGGSYSNSGSSSFSSGGSYQQVAPGPQTNEGANLDQGLLEQIKQVLLSSESQSSSIGGGYPSGPSSSYGAPSGGSSWSQASAPSSSYGAPSGGYSAPSSSYGAPSAPSSSYGAPSTGQVSGLDLEGIQQAIQVAQFTQQQQVSSGGYPSAPSGSYGAPSSGSGWSQQASAPSSSYGAPSRAPSGSYGAPF